MSADYFGSKLVNNQSLAAGFETTPFKIKYVDKVGINISTDGVTDNQGTFAIHHRIVEAPLSGETMPEASDWAELSLSSVPTLADEDTVMLLALNTLPPGEIKIVFSADGSSPDGSCDIWISGGVISDSSPSWRD